MQPQHWHGREKGACRSTVTHKQMAYHDGSNKNVLEIQTNQADAARAFQWEATLPATASVRRNLKLDGKWSTVGQEEHNGLYRNVCISGLCAFRRLPHPLYTYRSLIGRDHVWAPISRASESFMSHIPVKTSSGASTQQFKRCQRKVYHQTRFPCSRPHHCQVSSFIVRPRPRVSSCYAVHPDTLPFHLTAASFLC